MACFLVPASEAVVTTVAQKIIESKEKKDDVQGNESVNEIPKVRFSEKLSWLNKMLWGGSALLAFEHVWHGEVIPTAPFLTAVQNGEVADMLAEMGTAGVGMAVLVTLIWGGMVAASHVIENRKESTAKEEA
ncbi:MAG: hypothetical protein IJ591_00385 [Lachnospiraceae bacterium]|nr:hypothetical protein [Lachnospiraceae bacterium]MBR1450152.1 hypothetical protein [Lachnospiraceae bacterium]